MPLAEAIVPALLVALWIAITALLQRRAGRIPLIAAAVLLAAVGGTALGSGLEVGFGSPGDIGDVFGSRTLPGTAIALVLAVAFAIATWAKPVRWWWRWPVFALATLAIPAAIVTLLLRTSDPRILVSVAAPDGVRIAELVDFRWAHTFRVQLNRPGFGPFRSRTPLFTNVPSDDPGGWQTSARLAWSRDGRWLLLTYKASVLLEDACLASGDSLFLLVDTESGAVQSNSRKTSRRLRVAAVQPIDFGTPLLPGAPAGGLCQGPPTPGR